MSLGTLALALLLLWPTPGGNPRPPEVVNPGLQPGHLISRHRVVAIGRVAAVDEATGAVAIDIVEVVQGAFAPTRVTIAVGDEVERAFAEDDASPGIAADARAGETVVLHLGKTRRGGGSDSGLVYLDCHYHEVEFDAEAPGELRWREGFGQDAEMWGTFNGHPDRLAAMMRDAAAGRLYFPALAFTAFAAERELARVDGAVGGVAIADLDGDGRLDVCAAAPAGVRLLLQGTDGSFRDATAEAGLAGLGAGSVAVGDLDGDGDADLLLDASLRLGDRGRFADGGTLPGAGDGLLAVRLGDLDGDGLPDALVSSRSGLAAWRNPGGAGAWTDATAALGLAGLTDVGLPTLGLDGEGRLLLALAAGETPVSARGADGRFARLGAAGRLEFGAGRSGAGMVAAIWEAAGGELVLPGRQGLLLQAWRGGGSADLARYGNELKLGTDNQVATLAADLNADGRIDLLTLSDGGEQRLHTNRGYGTFMVEELYAREREVLAGGWRREPVSAAAAGDLDGDGALDLVVGRPDGRILLVRNQTLVHRVGQENPHPQLAAQLAMRHLRVLPRGRGVLGALVVVSAADGRVVARRTVGDAPARNAGPLEAVVTVPDAGPWAVRVRFSDGVRSEAAVDAGVAPAAVTIPHP